MMPERKELVAGWLQDKAKALQTHYRARNEQWADDRAILYQAYKKAIPDFPNILSAEPRNQHRLALDIMTLREPRFLVQIHDQDAAEQDLMNMVERFAIGLYREIDHAWRTAGNRYWVRDLDWYILMGGFAVRPIVMRDKDGDTVFRAQVCDPMEVCPEYSEDGLRCVCRLYTTYGRDIKQRAKRNGWNAEHLDMLPDDNEVDILDAYWVEEDDTPYGGPGVYNALQVAGKEVKPPTLEKQFSRIPVIVGPSSGSPFKAFMGMYNWPWGKPDWDWTASAWEGMFAPARETYKDLDELLSLMAKIVKDAAKYPIIEKTRQGQPKYGPQAFAKSKKLTYQTGEEVGPMQAPTSPRERGELLEYYVGSIQRSGLSFTAFGSLGMEVSGVTLEQLILASQSVLSPYVEASQYVMAQTLMMLMDQYRRGKFKDVDLLTRQNTRNVGERWYIESFKRTDIPKTVHLQVIKPLALPDTKLARIQALRAAYGDNRPLFSEQTGMEKLLEDLVPDIALERRRLDEDRARYSPEGDALSVIVGLIKAREAMLSRGDTEMAQIVSQIITMRMSVLQQVTAGGEQRTQGIVAQREAQGTPAPEMPPEMVPPEMGGVSPDAMKMAGNQAVMNVLQKRAGSMGLANGQPTPAR